MNSEKSIASVDQLEPEHYDVLVLGSGEGGKYLAWNLASSGRKTALVERRYIGGSCPNIACLPSKNIVHSAKIASLLAHATSYGLPQPTGEVNMETVRQRKRDMVTGLVQVHEERFRSSGVSLILGEGRFVSPKTIEVRSSGPTRVLTGDVVIISTGSRATVDPIPGLAAAEPLTHIEALELDRVPKHLIVLGGGYVGLEFAQAMRRFGSRVTIVEHNSRLLRREDEDIAWVLSEILVAEGIDVVTEANVTRVHGRSGDSVILDIERLGSTLSLEASHLLVATGRTPNTDHLQLDIAQVAVTRQGFIQVNERLETTASGVFAVGDCAGSPHFTHIAFDDYRVVRDNLNGKNRVTSGRLVPYCLFTDPELARVGLNEIEAQQKGLPYRLFTLPMKSVLRAVTTGETQGFLKALIAADNDTILGFTALGASAGEMIAPVQLAMTSNLPYTVLRDSIFTHPTFQEGLVYLFSGKPTLVNSSTGK
jgi:pyruvate/2-oxoglutarate dehydrogenase complex dihydrolipoamide dehydrogenase (E3) component